MCWNLEVTKIYGDKQDRFEYDFNHTVCEINYTGTWSFATSPTNNDFLLVLRTNHLLYSRAYFVCYCFFEDIVYTGMYTYT